MAKILFENKEDVYVDSSIPDINKVKADDMNNIKEAVNTNENKILLAISDTAPSTCATGDLYYNTTSKKIFEATGTNTWGTTGTNPTSNTIYILFDTKTTYSYDGTDLVSVGGGGAEVAVQTTEPTGEDSDSVKIWINPNEAPSGSLNPISNTYGIAQDKGYAQEYANGHYGGVVLYEDATGTNGDITLSDNISNYKYLELSTINADNTTETLGVFKFDTSYSTFTISGSGVSSSSFNVFSKTYTKGTNKLTASNGRLYSGTSSQARDYEVYLITKVVGYK